VAEDGGCDWEELSCQEPSSAEEGPASSDVEMGATVRGSQSRSRLALRPAAAAATSRSRSVRGSFLRSPARSPPRPPPAVSRRTSRELARRKAAPPAPLTGSTLSSCRKGRACVRYLPGYSHAYATHMARTRHAHAMHTPRMRHAHHATHTPRTRDARACLS